MSNQYRPTEEQDLVDRGARATALAATAQVAIAGTSLVDFVSRGRVLVIGAAGDASGAAARLVQHGLVPCVLAIDAAEPPPNATWPILRAGDHALRLAGHMGAFTILVEQADGPVNLSTLLEPPQDGFDLVLDLADPPLIELEVLPLGYFAPSGDPAKLDRALQELPELVGEFEKPRFFEYDPSICAHGRSGIAGCRRCLEACPTGAITSLSELIEVNPYYCQGGGSCATACPTGAIVYSYPKPGDLINRLRRLLRSYRESGGCNPILLFTDSEAGKARLDTIGDNLPGHVISVELEEVGSAGLDVWLTSLAFGAASVAVMDTDQVAACVRNEIDQQIELVTGILAGLGYPPAIRRIPANTENDSLASSLRDGEMMPDMPPAGFLGTSEKRGMIFLALDHLVANASHPEDVLEMPQHSPFGEVRVDQGACTLCMACVSVCPAAALSDGVDRPQLGFIEANCVQCGLCRTACPEAAIKLVPRLLIDREARRSRRVLHAEEPFACTVCGELFATRSVIDRMTEKLSAHWMFQDDAALRRLKMCQDCRVKDMFEAENGR